MVTVNHFTQKGRKACLLRLHGPRPSRGQDFRDARQSRPKTWPTTTWRGGNGWNGWRFLQIVVDLFCFPLFYPKTPAAVQVVDDVWGAFRGYQKRVKKTRKRHVFGYGSHGACEVKQPGAFWEGRFFGIKRQKSFSTKWLLCLLLFEQSTFQRFPKMKPIQYLDNLDAPCMDCYLLHEMKDGHMNKGKWLGKYSCPMDPSWVMGCRNVGNPIPASLFSHTSQMSFLF